MFLFKSSKKNKKNVEKKEINNNEDKVVTKYSFINKSENLEDCIICLDKMRLGERLMILKCSHIYHEMCIEK